MDIVRNRIRENILEDELSLMKHMGSVQEYQTVVVREAYSNNRISLKLPLWLKKSDKKAIITAVKLGKPILIRGPQTPTGKSFLVKLLNYQGVAAFEEWECQKIKLDRPIVY